MELSSLVGTPNAPNVPSEDGEGMSGVNEEPFDPIDTFLRELQADLVEPSQPTSTTTPTTVLCRRQRYNIAAANPLLAGVYPSYSHSNHSETQIFPARSMLSTELLFTEKLAAPAAELSQASIPYPTRTEIKTENVHNDSVKGRNFTLDKLNRAARLHQQSSLPTDRSFE